MALGNNPTQLEVVKAIKDLENATPTQITSINGLAGGQLTSALYLAGGDAVSGAANIQLDTNGQMTAKGTTSTLFGRSNATTLLVGHSSHALTLRGSATRPTYNGNALALSSDIPSAVTESTVSGWGFTKNAGTITGVQLNGKTVASNGVANVQALPNFSLNISHQTAGNPRPVKFLTVNYNTAATYFKMSATSCHDNGTSYQFLEDIIIGCTTGGTVVCNVYKYCQQAVTYDGATRNYGDVFYVIDTTNKKVDFFILCGQWASSQFTPATKIGNTTIAYITQHTGTATYYSSGTKVWASGDSTTYARLSDVPTMPFTMTLVANATGTAVNIDTLVNNGTLSASEEYLLIPNNTVSPTMGNMQLVNTSGSYGYSNCPIMVRPWYYSQTKAYVFCVEFPNAAANVWYTKTVNYAKIYKITY